MSGLRVPDAGGGRQVAFTFDGRRVTGTEGEPIAVALHAAGVRVLSRSFKLRRPRGLHCLADACPNCAMRVNGLPGVTTCTTPLRDGDVVERQKGAPSAEHDLLAVSDRLSRLTPVGFQYRRLRRSPRLFHHWERVLARLAGVGRVPDLEMAQELVRDARFEAAHADVVVVGAGGAGLAAALAAGEAGARVVLVEREGRPGGWLRYGGEPEDRAAVAELARAVAASPAVSVRLGATAAGWFAEDVLAVTSPAGLLELRAGAVVLATGAHERPLAFADNDRPGVMLAGGVQRLLREHGVRPGRRAVVVTSEDFGHVVAGDLVRAGVQVAGVADTRPGGARGDHGAEVLAGARVVAACGRGAVRGVRLAVGASTRELACDTIVVANGRRPARELRLQRSADGAAVEGWWLAGLAAGAQDVGEALDGARAAGAVAGGHAR